MIVLLFLGNVAWGQISFKKQEPSQNLMVLPQDPAANFNLISDTAIDFYNTIIQLKSGKPALLGAQFSHSTDNGIVFNLSPDNMPCLVTDISRNAPISTVAPKGAFIDKMPNPYKGNIKMAPRK